MVLPERHLLDIAITDAYPKFGPVEGGTTITVKGTGFYDSGGKKFKFETTNGEREMSAAWDRKEKCFTCKTPPISWYFQGKSPSNSLLQKTKESQIKLSLTLNGHDWIFVGYFEYYDPIVDRLAYDLGFGEGLPEAEIAKKWIEEEVLPLLPTDPEELKNLQAEEQKKAAEENEEFSTLYRRSGTRFYILGKNFKKCSVSQLSFILIRLLKSDLCTKAKHILLMEFIKMKRRSDASFRIWLIFL